MQLNFRQCHALPFFRRLVHTAIYEATPSLEGSHFPEHIKNGLNEKQQISS